MPKRFDIADFNDPVAEKTSWLPLKSKGDSYFLYNLVKVSPTQYRYPYSKSVRFVAFSFGIIGIANVLGGIDLWQTRGIARSYPYFIFATVCLIVPYYFTISLIITKFLT